jgi:WD40 repeat protein
VRRDESTSGRTLTRYSAGVRQVAFSPDGATVATADGAGTVRLWATSRGNPVKTLYGSRGVPTSLEFDHAGTTLAASSNGLSLWDTSTGRHKLGDPLRIV